MSPVFYAIFSLVVATNAFSATFLPLPDAVPYPSDNPPSEAKVSLGKQLFFDARISAKGEVSCFSCHNIMGSGENNLAYATKPDGKPSHHSVPTVWNAAFQTKLFWTGGAASLEEQAEGPLEEMGLGDTKAVLEKIKGITGYVAQFRKVFGSTDAVTLLNLTRALASFERTLVTRRSPFDRYLKGQSLALTPQALNGFMTFQKVGCATCHDGVNLSGSKGSTLKRFPLFQNQTDESQFHLSDDLGLYLATQVEADKNVWRVPSLRNVALTAPYFHNGSVPTLEAAVEVMSRNQLNLALKDQEVKDIVAFLKSLTGQKPLMRLPELP